MKYWFLLILFSLFFFALIALLITLTTTDTHKKISIWTVNLDEKKDRWLSVQRLYELSDLNPTIPLYRFPAISGKNIDPRLYLSDEALEDLYKIEQSGYRTKHHQLSRGAIGCYLSHLQLFKQLLQSNDDMYLILEDDAVIFPQSMRRLQDVIQHAPCDWDIILLTYIRMRGLRVNDVYSKVHGMWGTTGYIVNRKGASTFIKNTDETNIDAQIDIYLGYLSQRGILNIYALHEQMIHTLDEDSDIQVFDVYDDNDMSYMYRGLYI